MEGLQDSPHMSNESRCSAWPYHGFVSDMWRGRLKDIWGLPELRGI